MRLPSLRIQTRITSSSIRIPTISPPTSRSRIPSSHTPLPRAQPASHAHTRPRFVSSSTQPRLKMASDEDYMSFLNKANEDVSGGSGSANTTQKTSGGGKHTFKTTDGGAELPREIRDVTQDAFYVSDADEPFVGVSLKVTGEDSLPDEVEFAELIGHWDPSNADIEILTPMDWDRKGQYTNVVEAVQRATKGNDVMVYKVPVDATRIEYWVISFWEGRVVGVKALAVES